MINWKLYRDLTGIYDNEKNIIIDFFGRNEFINNDINNVLPMNWLNWVSITIDEKNDNLSINLSTNDVRYSNLKISLTRQLGLDDNDKYIILNIDEKDNNEIISNININGVAK